MAQVRLNRDLKTLPDRCIVCGKDTTIRESRTFQTWSSDFRAVVWVVAGPIAGALFGETFSQRATMRLPCCTRHSRGGDPEGQKRTRTVRRFGVLLGVCVAAAALFSTQSPAAPILPAALIVAGITMTSVSLLRESPGRREARRVAVVKITDGSVTLKGVSEEFARALNRHDDNPELTSFLRSLG
jgi:hypothetical protein